MMELLLFNDKRLCLFSIFYTAMFYRCLNSLSFNFLHHVFRKRKSLIEISVVNEPVSWGELTSGNDSIVNLINRFHYLIESF